MADRKLSGVPPPSLSSPSQQSGRIRVATPRDSLTPHHNGSLEAGLGCSHSITRAIPSSSSRTSSSTSPLRILRTLGGLMTPVSIPDPESSSTRPRGQSPGSALSCRISTTTSRSKVPPLKPDSELQRVKRLKCQLCDWLFVSEMHVGNSRCFLTQLFF